MAEFLEDFEKEDHVRKVDQGDFQASKFEVFTHDYREKGEPACCAKGEEEDHSKCEEAEQKAKRSKKEIVNITRKLQKALINLEMMAGSEAISDMLIAMRNINSELRDAIIKNNSEFSTTSVPLPDYDATDMKALLGEDQVPEQKTMLELVADEMGKNKAELEKKLIEAEILLQEYDHIKNGIKAGF